MQSRRPSTLLVVDILTIVYFIAGELGRYFWHPGNCHQWFWHERRHRKRLEAGSSEDLIKPVKLGKLEAIESATGSRAASN
jgi:hypothetical protein